jgi:hypothetical protein
VAEEVGTAMTAAGEERQVVGSVAEALVALPPGHFLLVTIETPDGNRPRVDAPILRPYAAVDVFGANATAEYGNLPCIALVWAETLEPLYAGHPGSVWPVNTARRVGDRVVLAGTRGMAIFRQLPSKRLAELCGEADGLQDGLAAAFGGAGYERPRLPLNRKERFYTGTVLPMIVARDGFRSLGRLLTLCGLRGVEGGKPSELQFFTEYSFAESVYTSADRQRFAYRPTNADTPDLVISGADWLLAIEAKMFHRPNAAALNAQYERQSMLIDYWRARFRLEDDRVRHVLLLPAALADSVAADVHAPFVTWESIADTYRDIPGRYWLNVLAQALDDYETLASKDSLWGQNTQLKLTGSQIVAAYEAGDPNVAWVGRRRGSTGPEFTGDIVTGSWQSHMYEIRATPPAGTGANWFRVTDFVARLQAANDGERGTQR